MTVGRSLKSLFTPGSIIDRGQISDTEKRYVTYSYLTDDVTIQTNTLVKVSTNEAKSYSIADMLPIKNYTIYSNFLEHSDNIFWKTESSAILNNVWCIRHIPTNTLITSPITGAIIPASDNMPTASKLLSIPFPLFSLTKTIAEKYLKMRLEVSNLNPAFGQIIKDLGDKKELSTLSFSNKLNGLYGSSVHPEANWRISTNELLHVTLNSVSNIHEYDIVYMKDYLVALNKPCISLEGLSKCQLTELTLTKFYNHYKPCMKLFRKYNYNVATNKYVSIKV